ncbi:GA-like domain-containing protein, partial [Pantoea sp. USHLN298]|uniref:GA-like domain-containing protein n=1 Tax=Pantoea sp. USHLN298 TaxID=3081294 RepID=UPI003FA6D578
TPAGAKAVEDANQALAAAKQAAQDAVSRVPDEAGEKGDLQARTDALKAADVPAITDADGNGVADFFKANNDFANYIIPKSAVKPKETFVSGSIKDNQSNTNNGLSLFFRFGNKPEINVTVDKNTTGKVIATFTGINIKLGTPYLEVYRLEGNGKETSVKTINGEAESWIGSIIGGITDIIPKYATLDLKDLTPGNYKVKAWGNSGIAAGIDSTEITLDKVRVETYDVPEAINKNALPLLKGDVIKNDANDGVKNIKVSAVEGKEIAHSRGSDSVTIKGKYGELKAFANGNYEYKANNLSVNDIKKENVDKFTYKVSSPDLPGLESSAVLEIKIQKFDVTAVDSRVKRAVSDDNPTQSAEAESHNNSKATEVNKPTLFGKLLTTSNGHINLDSLSGKDKTSDLKVVTADSREMYSGGAWHSDVKLNHDEHTLIDI